VVCLSARKAQARVAANCLRQGRRIRNLLCKETLFCRTVPANMSTANPTSNLISSENVAPPCGTKIGEIDHLMIDRLVMSATP
jgi:hypothetical protein